MVATAGSRSLKKTDAVATRNTRKRGRDQRAVLVNIENQQEKGEALPRKATRSSTRRKSAKCEAGPANGTAQTAETKVCTFEAFVDSELRPKETKEADGNIRGNQLKKHRSVVSSTDELATTEPETQQSIPSTARTEQAAAADAAKAAEVAQQLEEEASVNTLARPHHTCTPPAATESALSARSHDSQAVTWYSNDIYQWYRQQEALFRPPVNYLELFERDINAQMRGILIDWIVEVSEMYNLTDQTIFLCTNYIDRYVGMTVVPRNNLQLVGVTCLQIASKFQEVSCPLGEQFAYISVTPVEEIMKTERRILKALEYRLCIVTALDFCGHFCRICGASATSSMLAQYFLELTLQEYAFLAFTPSMIAATAMKIALWYHDSISWDMWASACGYTTEELRGCSEQMQQMLRSVHKTTLPAVREKYSHSKCLRVSNFCLESLALEDEEQAEISAAQGSIEIEMALQP